MSIALELYAKELETNGQNRNRDFPVFLLVLLQSRLSHDDLGSIIHICVTDMHTALGIADKFLVDVRASVRELRKDAQLPVTGKMAIYGMAQALSDRSVVGDVTRCYLNSMYYTPSLDEL
uniref:Uncharacterized protein n=1 Tax=Glossina palpalis gambiensis TaxID=67801 RepID=A0A1B0BFD4_9MUSC